MKLWLVGGTVRDHVLGLPTGKSDLDFAVEARSFDEMKTGLLALGATVWQERPEFVTLRASLLAEKLGDFGGVLHGKGTTRKNPTLNADFTLCRAEAMYTDGRHPDRVTPAGVTTDLARRDFTMNAVAVSEGGVWLDPFDGQGDLDDHLLRCVGFPAQRFDEDPLRMLRAFRFMVTHGLVAEDTLSQCLNDPRLLSLLRKLPVERVREEMNKAFTCDWLRAAQLLSNELSALGCTVQTLFPKLGLRATQ